MNWIEYILIIILVSVLFFFMFDSWRLQKELNISEGTLKAIYDLHLEDKKALEWYLNNHKSVKIYVDENNSIIVEHKKDWR